MNTQAIVGQKYVVTKRYWFNVGDTVTYKMAALVQGSGGFFVNESGEEHYVSFDDVELVPIVSYKTPCQQRGMEVGQKFKMIGDRGSWFKIGDIVTLTKDDGSIMPHFICGEFNKGYAMVDDTLAYIEPLLTPMQLAGHKIGDKFVTTDDKWFANGEVITFYYDDCSDSPMFKSDSSGKEWHKVMKYLIPYVAPQVVTADITELTANQRLLVLAIIAAFKETK